MRAFRAALLVSAAALAACGDTLVDHRATDVRQGPGALVCTGNAPISCRIAGADTCQAETVKTCGSMCDDCTNGFVPPHASAIPACIGSPGAGSCDYECTGGLLKCPGALGSCCPAVSVAAGKAHACARTVQGGLYCWGENAEGQVTGGPSVPPVTVPRKWFDSGVLAVAAGEAHTCAALADDVRCWGRGPTSQAPPSVPFAGATALAAGVAHTCALVGATGEVRCWGAGDPTGGGTPIASGATAITAGADHTCAIVAGGRVVCWGANVVGQLGDGSTQASSTPVEAIPSGVRAIGAGGRHTCAATETPTQVGNVSDAIRCWGDAPGATFGLAEPQLTPADPRKSTDQSVIRYVVARVSAGRTHTCVQKAGDLIECFGPIPTPDHGQLGGAAVGTEAIAVPNSTAATAFAAGADHTCAVYASGGVHCWGFNGSGQLGNASATLVSPGTIVPVSGR